MSSETKISNYFSKIFEKKEDVFCDKNDQNGYWSNLNVDENKDLLLNAKKSGTKKAIQRLHPKLYDVIFSPKREGGLELLELSGNELCIDYGCMWGALSVPLAKRCKTVISVDQTFESLKFLKYRLKDENLTNVFTVNHNLRTFPILPKDIKADIALVNGVLEWVPEIGKVELKKIYGKKEIRKYEQGYNPKKIQTDFLVKVRENLKSNGKLYLAIENRYDYKMFFGVKDPHSNLHLTTILPKKIANIYSNLILGRPYVNWIYSKDELKKLVKDAGYSDVNIYIAFPDYRFPEYIQNYKKKLRKFTYKSKITDPENNVRVKRIIARIIETILFFLIGAKFLAPSFIVIAKK